MTGCIFSHDEHLFHFRLLLFNTIFNNTSIISWQSIILMEETGVFRENNTLPASYWQTLSRVTVIKLITLVVSDTDCISGCKSKSYTITGTIDMNWCWQLYIKFIGGLILMFYLLYRVVVWNQHRKGWRYRQSKRNRQHKGQKIKDKQRSTKDNTEN